MLNRQVFGLEDQASELDCSADREGAGPSSPAASVGAYDDYELDFPLGDVTGGVKGIREALVQHLNHEDQDADPS
jgi:hypothetical protein